MRPNLSLVYSLGVVLYELLTGMLPFDSAVLKSGDLDEIRRIICEDEPATLSARLSTSGEHGDRIAHYRRTSATTLTRRIRGELDWITMKALEKDRSRRYQSASKFALDIERFLRDEPVLAGPPSAAYRLQKLVKRHKRIVGTFVAVVAALVIGLGVSIFMFLRAESARDRVEQEARKAEQINTLSSKPST